jgi:hypothetical protein
MSVPSLMIDSSFLFIAGALKTHLGNVNEKSKQIGFTHHLGIIFVVVYPHLLAWLGLESLRQRTANVCILLDGGHP